MVNTTSNKTTRNDKNTQTNTKHRDNRTNLNVIMANICTLTLCCQKVYLLLNQTTKFLDKKSLFQQGGVSLNLFSIKFSKFKSFRSIIDTKNNRNCCEEATKRSTENQSNKNPSGKKVIS